MHQPIQDNLEDYLRDPRDRDIPPEFRAHLAACKACANEVGTLEAHNRLLRALRAEEDTEPTVGFYARVMNRIEVRRSDSFWNIFLEPSFGRRLALGCGALVLLMATYLVTTEPGSNLPAPSGVAPISRIAEDSIQPQQRDAVLVNLASYHE
jgi:hypothetical protein